MLEVSILCGHRSCLIGVLGPIIVISVRRETPKAAVSVTKDSIQQNFSTIKARGMIAKLLKLIATLVAAGPGGGVVLVVVVTATATTTTTTAAATTTTAAAAAATTTTTPTTTATARCVGKHSKVRQQAFLMA